MFIFFVFGNADVLLFLGHSCALMVGSFFEEANNRGKDVIGRVTLKQFFTRLNVGVVLPWINITRKIEG